MTYSYISSSDLKNVLRLKEFLGGRTVTSSLRAGEHPLARGFRAEERFLTGATLAQDSRNLLSQLILDANTLFELEQSWQSHEQDLKKALLTANECNSLLFELHVIDSLKTRVGFIQWRRFEHGAPDIETDSPNMLLECMLLRQFESTDDLFEALRNKEQQHRGIARPYAVCLGALRLFGASVAIHMVKELIQRKSQWIANHLAISSVLIYMPTHLRASRQSRLTEFTRLTEFRRYKVVELRNNNAVHPTPSIFGTRG